LEEATLESCVALVTRTVQKMVEPTDNAGTAASPDKLVSGRDSKGLTSLARGSEPRAHSNRTMGARGAVDSGNDQEQRRGSDTVLHVASISLPPSRTMGANGGKSSIVKFASAALVLCSPTVLIAITLNRYVEPCSRTCRASVAGNVTTGTDDHSYHDLPSGASAIT
jgi:hypothetical protein